MPVSSNFAFYAISTGEYTNGNNNLPGVKNSMERLIKILQKYRKAKPCGQTEFQKFTRLFLEVVIS